MTSIAVNDLASIESPTVIDVRESDEIRAIRAVGVTPIPLSAFLDRIDEVPRDTTVYVICASGARSQRVSDYLNENGWDAVNVEGGTQAWQAAGLPVERG
ncbi:rhodanese-like domain-containing protein [Okibacterium endophyticum]